MKKGKNLAYFFKVKKFLQSFKKIKSTYANKSSPFGLLSHSIVQLSEQSPLPCSPNPETSSCPPLAIQEGTACECRFLPVLTCSNLTESPHLIGELMVVATLAWASLSSHNPFQSWNSPSQVTICCLEPDPYRMSQLERQKLVHLFWSLRALPQVIGWVPIVRLMGDGRGIE